MAQVDPDELDAVWEEFHTVVNMTSRELSEWLLTDEAGPDGEQPAEQGGAATGRQVLHVLSKRKGDVNGDDLALMREVVEVVRGERGEELEPTAGDAQWRHRLMALGHDPLKP
jgi:hypothetical protein